MVGIGQAPLDDDHIQQAHVHYFSPPPHGAALALPPIADLDYQFRFSSAGSAHMEGPHVGSTITPAITPTLEPDFRFNVDLGMGSVALSCEFDRGTAVEDGIQWGQLGMMSSAKIRSSQATPDGLIHDEVYKLLGSIGRLSPLMQGFHRQTVVPLSPLLAQAVGEHSTGHSMHVQRAGSANHGSESFLKPGDNGSDFSPGFHI